LTDALRGGDTSFTFNFPNPTTTVAEAASSGSAVGGATTVTNVAPSSAEGTLASSSNSLLVSQQGSATTAVGGPASPTAQLGDVTPPGSLGASLILGASSIARGGGDTRDEEALAPGEGLTALMAVFRNWAKAALDMGDASEPVVSAVGTGWRGL